MSSFLAAFGPGSPPIARSRVEAVLASLSWRGRDQMEVSRCGSGILGASRDQWEMEPAHAGSSLIGECEGIAVVSDATIYHRADLISALTGRGIRPRSEACADLIAAAVRAFGPGAPARIEGDFAFVAFDPLRNLVMLARDPFGSRGLYYRMASGGLFAASMPQSLVALHDGPETPDLEGILRALALRPGAGDLTAWASVRELPAGHVLISGRTPSPPVRFWRPSADPGWAALPHERAVETLRSLLRDAVAERLDPGGVAVAMSGGYDSTSVAALALEARPSDPLSILSLRYPEGDPGNEDDMVRRVATHLDLEVKWVGTDRVGVLEAFRERARKRSGLDGHPHEGQNRALATQCRELGNRVLLNGHGGDNVFWVSDALSADYLLEGRWRSLRRFLMDRGQFTLRGFVGSSVLPAIPLDLQDSLRSLLGRGPAPRPIEVPPAPWIAAGHPLMTRIAESDRGHYRDTVLRTYRRPSEQERAWSVLFGGFSRINARLFDCVRDEGVELRMPLWDRRLADFAMSRPPEEFNRPGEIKCLFRDAMKGGLPSAVLGPRGQRAHKSGTADGYIRRKLAEEFPRTLTDLAREGVPWSTGEAGLLSEETFVRSLESWLDRDRRWEVPLVVSVLVEVWLQEHLRG